MTATAEIAPKTVSAANRCGTRDQQPPEIREKIGFLERQKYLQYQLPNNWLGKQDSNQSMHFICIAFNRRKTRSISGEFAVRNSNVWGRRAGCYSGQVYRGRASVFQGAEPAGLLPQWTHCYGRRPVDLLARRRTEGSPRDLRGFGSCERQFRRAADQRSPNPCRPFQSRSPRIQRARHPKREAPNQTRHPGARPRPLRIPPSNRRGLLNRRPREPPPPRRR
jgi:hypothetical protein